MTGSIGAVLGQANLRIEVHVHDRIRCALQNRIEFRKDHPDRAHVVKPVKIGVENGKQLVFRDELQLEAVAGFLLVRGDDLERASIVGRHEQSVRVFVNEVALQTREELLDHAAHRVIGRVTPAVERDVDQRPGL